MKEKTVNIGKLKTEPWMITGIRRSSQKLKKFYKLYLKQGRDPCVRETYILYRNCLNKVKRACKVCYFKNHCQTYKQYW